MANSKYNSTKYGPNKTPDDSQPIDYKREYKVPLHGNGVHAMYGGTDDTQPYPNGSGGLLPSGEANFFDTAQSHSYNPLVWNEGYGPSGINAFYPSGDYEKFREYATAKFGAVPSDPQEFTEWVLHQTGVDGLVGLKSGVFLTYPEAEWDVANWTRQSGILHFDKRFFEAGSGDRGWIRTEGVGENRDRLAQSQYSNAERTLEVIRTKEKLLQIRNYIPDLPPGSILGVGDDKTQRQFTPYIHYSPFQDGSPIGVYINFLADYKYSTNWSSPYN